MDYKYIKTNWQDHIVDPETNEVIQQGTRFTASRANNIETAVEYLCNVQVPKSAAEFLRIQLELEMLGRSPVNNGTFFDVLDGETPKLMVRDNTKSVLQSSTSAGTTQLTLDSVQFVVGEVVTVTDEEVSENVTITAVSGNVVTISATVNAFKKGAYVTRSNALFDTNTLALKFNNWATYTVEVV